MWTRFGLKLSAREILKKSYWICFLACMIYSLLSQCSLFLVNYLVRQNEYAATFQSTIKMLITSPNAKIILNSLLQNSQLISVLLGILIIFCFMMFDIFFMNHLFVGLWKFFVSAGRGNVNLKNLFYYFTHNYLKVLKVMFIKNLFICLWSCLFLIPGIIKAYQYRMVDFILIDHPEIGCRECLQLSKRMTYGHKWKMFLLNFSFLGWSFLSVLATELLATFIFNSTRIMLTTLCMNAVLPYYYATLSQLYETLKRNDNHQTENAICDSDY